MALILEKPQRSGVLVRYWRLENVAITRQGDGSARFEAMFGGFLDESVRRAGKLPAASIMVEGELSATEEWSAASIYAAAHRDPVFQSAKADV